jgi:hypothetical protein
LDCRYARLSRLDTDVAVLLEPYMEYVGELLAEPLDFNRFCDVMEVFIETLTPTEKAVLLPTSLHKKGEKRERLQKNASFTFQPNRSAGSMRTRQQAPDSTETIKRLLESQERKEESLRALQTKLAIQEMEECTFQPATTKYVRPPKKSSFDMLYLAGTSQTRS